MRRISTRMQVIMCLIFDHTHVWLLCTVSEKTGCANTWRIISRKGRQSTFNYHEKKITIMVGEVCYRKYSIRIINDSMLFEYHSREPRKISFRG